ncbi:MAG: four helix bundle protein [Saprospiraceae bacterium]|jgi:four helix bundle protein
MESRSFEDLEIYKKARVLRNDIFKLTSSFPAEEKYRLTDQIIRSTRKCPANIAEGHGRYHF